MQTLRQPVHEEATIDSRHACLQLLLDYTPVSNAPMKLLLLLLPCATM
jgi:hypothetical protein